MINKFEEFKRLNESVFDTLSHAEVTLERFINLRLYADRLLGTRKTEYNTYDELLNATLIELDTKDIENQYTYGYIKGVIHGLRLTKEFPITMKNHGSTI